MEKLFKDIISLKKFILKRYNLEKIESRLQPEVCGLELKLNLAASLLNCLYSRKVKRFRINLGYFVSVISFQLFDLSLRLYYQSFDCIFGVPDQNLQAFRTSAKGVLHRDLSAKIGIVQVPPIIINKEP